MSDLPAIEKRIPTGLYVRGKNGQRLRDEKTRRLLRKMREAMPSLTDADIHTARAWCELEILASTVYAALVKHGPINKRTLEGRRLLDDYRKLRQTQLMFARELGLSPAARRSLGIGKGDDAIDIVARMARAEGTDSDG